MHIYHNDALTTLAAFPALTAVAGSVIISHNDALAEISGFCNLLEIEPYPSPVPEPGATELGGSFIVSHHPSLERITGFGALIVVQRNFTIDYNDVLTSLVGLHDVKAIGGAFIVTNNPELCVSEAALVGADLKQGPGPGSSSANNKDC